MRELREARGGPHFSLANFDGKFGREFRQPPPVVSKLPAKLGWRRVSSVAAFLEFPQPLISYILLLVWNLSGRNEWEDWGNYGLREPWRRRGGPDFSLANFSGKFGREFPQLPSVVPKLPAELGQRRISSSAASLEFLQHLISHILLLFWTLSGRNESKDWGK